MLAAQQKVIWPNLFSHHFPPLLFDSPVFSVVHMFALLPIAPSFE